MTEKIIVAGAGSIGCFVGGFLKHGGHNVELLARPRIADQIAAHGLTVSDLTGMSVHIAPEEIPVALHPEIMTGASLILVCVKSGATAEMGALIAQHAPEDAVVISLQNGVMNADILREALPGRDVRAGMVPYNVVQLGDGKFHRGTNADIVIDAGPGDLAETLTGPGLKWRESDQLDAIQWGKLLINLGNAINALSGIPLKDQYENGAWRKLVADQIDEGLEVLEAEGIEPAKALPIETKTFVRLLRLPTPVLRVTAGKLLKIDPAARSSMWEDLQLGRMTEIDQLQGEIIRLGEKHGISTPVNAVVAAHVKAVEGKPEASPGLTPKQVRAAPA